MDSYRSAGATVLLGMAGFVVGAQVVVAGELHLFVETVVDTAACAGCGSWAVGHGRRRVLVRDLAVSGRPTVLCWAKRIWCCPDGDCDVRSWTEISDAMPARAVLSWRAGAELCRLVGEDGWSVAAAARHFGVGWATAMNAVRDHGRPLVDDPSRTAHTTALGVDETTFLHAAADRRTTYVTGLVDLDRAQLIDVVAGRSGRVVADWLVGRPQQWRDQITVAATDAFRGYANAIGVELPDAMLVMDHFHAIALANRAVDAVRRRAQNDTLEHRGRRGDPLYRIRRVLLVAAERLNAAGWDRLIAGLEVGDPDGELAAAWLAKELLRKVYAAKTVHGAHRALGQFYTHCAEREIPELVTLATTVSNWQDEIIAYHHSGGVSNGPAEAVNLLIEKTRRIGHGFRNFDNYRLRLLLACGVKWHTPPAARIRGRQTRSAA